MIIRLDRAAERIQEEVFGHGSDKLIAMAQQHCPQSSRPLKVLSAGEGSGRVDRLVKVPGAPTPNRVKIFQREAQRVHRRVAPRAGWVLGLLLEPLAHRGWFASLTALGEGRYVGWRGERRGGEDVLEQELASQHPRGAGWVGGAQRPATP